MHAIAHRDRYAEVQQPGNTASHAATQRGPISLTLTEIPFSTFNQRPSRLQPAVSAAGSAGTTNRNCGASPPCEPTSAGGIRSGSCSTSSKTEGRKEGKGGRKEREGAGTGGGKVCVCVCVGGMGGGGKGGGGGQVDCSLCIHLIE